MPTCRRRAWWHDGLINEHSEPRVIIYLVLSCMIDAGTVAVSHVSGSFRNPLVFYDHVVRAQSS